MKTELAIAMICLPALFLVAIVNAQEYRNHDSGEGWSGVISYRFKSTFRSPSRSGFDEWVIEVRAANGKVTSKATNTFSKSGPDCNDNISGSQATSESISKFSFSLKTENNRHYFGIDEGMPILRGSRTICGKKEAIWQDDLALLIEDIEIGNNPNVISGDTIISTKRKHGSETFDEELKMSVSLTRGPIEVELIVFPGDYETWLPLPAKVGNVPGSIMDVAFKLQAKGGGKSPLKVKHFEVLLQNTSGEPGITINFPFNTNSNDPDLKLVSYGDNPVSANGQNQRIRPTSENSGAAMIASFDGGAYTTLTVHAIMENNEMVKGELFKKGGDHEILIPKRKVGSKIAEAWAMRYGNPGDEQDEDKSTSNNNPGDGLSAYEEYRGVLTEGRFMRLDPTKKELAIQSANETQKQEFLNGFKLFTEASGINVIRLEETELPPTRVLNANKGSAHLIDQHGLKIRTGSLGEGVFGVNRPAAKLVKTPRLSEEIIIDVAQIRQQFNKQKHTLAAAGISMPYTVDQNIANTVAHEIAHGVHVDHHGGPSNEINRLLGFASSIPVLVFDINGTNVSADTSINRSGKIGTEPCEQSGDITCIMAYTQQYQWAYKKTADAFLYYAVPPLPVGHHFCTSSNGTGINAGGKYFGNAKTGNCMAQLKVKDN